MLKKFILPGSLLIALSVGPQLAMAENIVDGDIVITDEMYNQELDSLGPGNRRKFLTTLPYAGQLVNDMYSRQKMVLESEKRGLEKDPKVMYMIERSRQGVLKNAVLNDITENLEMPDFEPLAKQEYQLNLDKYQSKESVHAHHILIIVDAEVTDKQAKEKIDAILVEARAGADFETLAKEYSGDKGSQKKGGDLGWFDKGRMVKTFDEVVFAMKNPGDISDVVKTSFGYHIIRFDERRSPAQLSFDDVKASIMRRLQSKYVETEVNRQYNEIADPAGANANIELLDKTYQAARVKYGY